MEDLGNKYALAALKTKRATLASEIVDLESQLRHRKESMFHVDATLRLLDPSIEPGDIPNKRLTKRIKLFRQGELSRTIVDALRRAGHPIGTREIVDALLAFGGHGESARKAVAGRVRGNLAYLVRRGKVSKEGDGKDARWLLV